MLRLNFKKYGNGKPLLVLHGFLGSLDNWHTLSTEWGKNGIEVYAIDLRNHGRSPHTPDHSIRLMAGDILDFMEQQRLEQTSVLGHSMGGKVAMHFALAHPEKMQKLIVADMAPRAYKRGHDDVFNAIFKVNLGEVQSRKEAEEAMKPYLGDFGTRQFVLKNLERNANGKYEWKFNLQTLYKDYEEVLKEIPFQSTFNGEVLFLKGSLSGYVQDKDKEAIYRLFPHAVIRTIENAGHWLHADKPKEFFEAVKAFINP